MRLIFCLLMASLLLPSCRTTPTTAPAVHSSGLPDLTYPLDQPLVSGHRGCIGAPAWPENCLETYQYLRKKVPGIMECDVARTKDGVLILMHDNSVDRTTNGTGKVSNLLFSEIKNLRLKDDLGNLTDYRVPTFEAILDWAKNSQTILSVDIKRSVSHEEVIDLIRASKASPNCIVITYSLQQAIDNYQYAPELFQSVSIRNQEEYDRWAERKLPPPERVIAFTGTRRSPSELYTLLHEQGIPAIFGTFGNIDRQAAARGSHIYHELLDKGVDIIATNTPLVAQQAIEQYREPVEQ